MLIIGLLILVLAVLFILYVVTGADGSTTIEALNVSTTMPVLTLFLSGMGALAAAGLGLWLMALGLRSSAKRRKREKKLEREAREARGQREPAVAGPADRGGLREGHVANRPADRDAAPRYEDHQAPARDGLRGGDLRDDRPGRDEAPRYEDHQEPRPLQPSEPLRTDPRTDEDPYPRRGA
ncbi:hypothetical protein ACH0CA_10160 [Kytococcus sedentarius]|uniref:hypothetical protein n=1 Tax=Kytococcus sedentarius TaxID=1276 RepID=UPI00387A2217